MNFLTFIFDHTVSIIEAYIWYRLMTNMLERKYSKKVYVIAASMIIVLLSLKTAIFSLPFMENLRAYGSLVIIVYTLIAAIVLFKSTLFEKLIWWGIYYIGLVSMELVVIFFMIVILRIPMTEISNNEVINQTASIVTKIFTLVLFEIFINRRKAKLQIKPSIHRNLSFLVVFNVILLLGSVVVFFNLNNTDNNLITIVQLFFAIMLIILLTTIFLVFKIERDSRKELETKLKLQQMELELRQNKDITKITDNLRKLRHDMNNHIGLIKNFVYAEQYDNLKTYVDEVYSDIAIANEYIVAENRTLSVLLNAKKDLAKQQGIDFQSFVAVSEINIQDKDLCALIGNILDNAIEAAGKSPHKKFIDFAIQKTNSECIIQCENSLRTKPVVKKGIFLSGKGDNDLHGIGTLNIKDIVAKYKGTVTFDYNDEVFQLRIVLPIG
ncbi:MAG: hypothetical protein H6Q59_737 [Firmicutes bacterium]|nr:hypothetical protein [Bacillota bacterium]